MANEDAQTANREPRTANKYTHAFTFRGKTLHLYKRQQTPHAPWHFRLRRGGEDKPRSLKTADAETAVKRARQALQAHDQGTDAWRDHLDATRQKAKPNSHTVGELLAAYQTAAAVEGNKPRTIHNNAGALRLILRAARELPTTEAADALTLTALQRKTVAAYKASVAAQADAAPDDTAAQRIRRSANSLMRQARSIFNRHLREHYQHTAGLRLPETLDEFLATPMFKAVAKQEYWPPTDTVIESTFQALPTLQRDDPNAFAAIWLALGYGLRKSEIAATRCDWFITRDGLDYLRGDRIAKDGILPDVRAMQGAALQLRAQIQQRAAAQGPDAYLLSGIHQERTDQVFRRVGDWLAGHGWKTQKKIHELRAWAICQVIIKNGWVAGSQWARHKQVSTTQEYYGRYVKSQEIKETIAAPFQPKILPAAEGQ